MSAGNQLYHVVVDNDDIATRITSLLAADKAGRVTFVPLNRMRPQPVRALLRNHYYVDRSSTGDASIQAC